jgi:hypothetical protein
MKRFGCNSQIILQNNLTLKNLNSSTEGAFTLAIFACDFTLSLHILQNKIKKSFLNVQA